MAEKLTRLSHKIAIQLHLVAERCTICRSRSRRPVRKLLDTPSYLMDYSVWVFRPNFAFISENQLNRINRIFLLHISLSPSVCNLIYEGVSKSFRTGRLERELQMVHLSATRCSFIAILWVSLVSFAAITLCIASQRAIQNVSVYFLMIQSGNVWIHPRISRNYPVIGISAYAFHILHPTWHS
jgi:hypothetical protein